MEPLMAARDVSDLLRLSKSTPYTWACRVPA